MEDKPGVEVFSREIEQDGITPDTSWELYEGVLGALRKITPETLRAKLG